MGRNKRQSATAPNRRALIYGAGLSAALMLPRLACAQDSAQPDVSVVVKRLDWAGIRIEHREIAVYIDAIAPQDGSPMPADFESTRRVKYGLVTHGHGDHFDIQFLRSVLGERGVVFCPRDVVGDIDTRVLRVQPVGLWEPVFMPRSGADVVAVAVPASDGFGVSQTSWVLRAGDKRIIHCGDTLWHGEFWDIGRALGPFDVAFLPINGARQNLGRFQDLGQAGSMTPQQAVAAARALNARVVVPIHYGQIEPTPDYIEIERALEDFKDEARRHSVGVRVLGRGEELVL